METKEIITLKEFQTKSLSKDMISEEVSEILKIKFHKQIDLLPPWVGTNFQWQVTSQGWVGFIPVTSDFSLSLLPKVPLKNLFGMLTYAFKLNVFFPEGEYQANTLQEFYDFLAGKLSEFVLTRARKGLFRDYLSRDSELPYVRGRINLRELIQSPWKININNHYQEHTADVEFNQILSYTLSIILRSGLCSKKVLPKIRSAHRVMSRYSRPIPFTSKESINFLYNRLNQDYQPMHILCRFFIEHIGPRVNIGEQTMLPFLVNMWHLFELFVFEWLKRKLPSDYKVNKQEKFYLGDDNNLYFEADLVIEEKYTGEVKYILDTKYKNQTSPEANDLAQVIAYAQTKGAKEAVLIYPINLDNPFHGNSGDINLRCLSFCIEDDLEIAGHKFLQQLFNCRE